MFIWVLCYIGRELYAERHICYSTGSPLVMRYTEIYQTDCQNYQSHTRSLRTSNIHYICACQQGPTELGVGEWHVKSSSVRMEEFSGANVHLKKIVKMLKYKEP
ncbi:conserved hypothetical protein [Trichinella spiralis]|uniref:Uncharacterized protein n=1 Tax=Trichinella spiralis TaxID=6334 RepID=E5STR0_TRISP|nr:conserved hypothetical protein [Trichinella spiralis]KRY39679.1 hypothetical protein T01_13101 [Trichinella spiralis]